MEVYDEGIGKLLGWQDPDDARHWVRINKSRDLVDKRMSASDAVHRFVHNNALIVFGGFGHVRVPSILIYEMIRQRKRNLSMAAKPGCHDADLLISAGCVTEVEVGYCFGQELRGLSAASRRAVETGKCQVAAEISNAAFQWRFLAAMMGIPFIPSRVLFGTDTFTHSACKVVQDPYSGKRVCLIPACYPDIAMIHVHRCDRFGNAQIDGNLVDDFEIARAARRLIITTEHIIPESRIRKEPWRTTIPFYLVDAVVEAPYGCHPCQMPLIYFSDEEHLSEWLAGSKTPDGTAAYVDKYILAVENFQEYLQLIGGATKLQYLRQVEDLQTQMRAPWIEQRKR